MDAQDGIYDLLQYILHDIAMTMPAGILNTRKRLVQQKKSEASWEAAESS